MAVVVVAVIVIIGVLALFLLLFVWFRFSLAMGTVVIKVDICWLAGLFGCYPVDGNDLTYTYPNTDTSFGHIVAGQLLHD